MHDRQLVLIATALLILGAAIYAAATNLSRESVPPTVTTGVSAVR